MPEAVINGLQHYWEDHGEGEPLIMFHGASQSNVSLAHHALALSKTHRVIVPDMRAMGRSAHVSEMPPSAWTDDAKALLDHLGLQRVHVFGISLGARVALRLAIDHPALVKTLTLELPIIAMEGATNTALNVNLGSFDNLSEADQKMRENQHGTDWRNVLANYMSIRNKPELQEHYSLRETSKGVRVPTLILRGDEREVVHPLGHCFELHQNIPGSWLWIRPNTNGSSLNAAPEEGYALMRALMANGQ
ncbi:alpha/beta fold hydrolase [Phenylobacterium sp.]|uniref:alpha/beta fold hydrolase n=1 Tax=Phenylobacterium sp. TaxID=1871053 RepID=UPI002732D1A7|nr:alpha/beta hydrolase [Phenylobacterium sp.]MDP3659240.1 alpha/beta hydrolase [Phenylobacterium sp.]